MNHSTHLCTVLLLSWVLASCGGGSGSNAAVTPTAPAEPTTPTTSVTPEAFALGALSSATAGYNQTAALRAPAASSVTYMWGDNTWGQVGDGTLATPKPTPLPVVGATTAWRSVAIGATHTLAIKSDGSLWAWGLNLNGQLGDGAGGAGRYRTAPVQIGATKDWLAVAAGESHSVAIQGTASSNKLVAWGQNAYSQLGLSTTLAGGVAGDTRDSSAPTQITKISDAATLTTLPVAGKPWRSIAVGNRHTLALRADGQIFTWGDDTYGQLGQLASANRALATNILVIGAATNALAIAAGANHSLAIQTDNTLWAWGDNTYGQLGVVLGGGGTSSSVGIQVGSDADWFTVAGGGRHTLAIKRDRTLWAWGSNEYGQLGDGTTSDSSIPVKIGTSTNWIAVSAGKDHSLAIDTDGKLWIWGRNSDGQLGNGVASTAPVLVPTLFP